VLPLPEAIAGGDTTICAGESAKIGRTPDAGHRYLWTPADGLDNPNSANPLAVPAQKTEYILTETNENGCVNYDTVNIDIRQQYELAFALSPAVISILPGEKFNASLHIPAGVLAWTVHIDYNPHIAGFDSILLTSNKITATAKAVGGVLTVGGTGENGDVLLGFHAYLPEQFDTDSRLSLGVTSFQSNRCDFATAKGAVLELGEFCAKNFRLVSGTGKSYFLRAGEHRLEFGVGIAGRIRLELYDYSGRLREVIADSFIAAGDYAVDITLPSGVYFCRMSAGEFRQVMPFVIVR
jgi:hypothetical protein